MFTANSKVDSKGRISIPIRLRARLGILEGSVVKMSLNGKEIVLVSNGQNGVKVCTGDCGSSRAGSIPASGPKGRLK